MTFVGVCGGRGYRDALKVAEAMEREIRPGDVVVTGAATGADSLARAWAKAKGHQIIDVPALWNWRGFADVDRGAGHKRNAVIAALPLRLMIVFPGGRGTDDMRKKALDATIEIRDVR